jgi:serine/threonine protein kinase
MPEAPLSRGQLPAGFVVDAKYSIERVLGEGGMGIVYLARDIHTHTPVVVKSIRAEFADNQEFRTRILAEGRALARIDHPNVVRLNALVVEARALYLIMQFIDGEPLDRLIRSSNAHHTPVSLGEALRIFRMILEGVGAAHREGVIHRDLKPANILVRKKDGAVKVTDFGIAKWEEDAKAGRGVTQGIIGSLYYMAPEQIRGQRDLDKRVDIYALGILLFELLTGRLPFDAASDYEVMKLHTEAPMPSLREVRPDSPPLLDEIIRRAAAKNREERYESAEAFLAALEGIAPSGFTARAALTPSVPAPPDRVVPLKTEPLAAPVLELRGVTGGGASITASTAAAHLPRKSIAPWVALGVVAFAAGGAALFVMLGPSSSTSGPKPTAPDASASAPVTAAVPASAQPSAQPPAKSPLAALVGHWRSETRHDYEAVLAGDTLEFRIQLDAEQASKGYEAGEVRFKLAAIAGKDRQYGVEDHFRPSPPPKLEFDRAAHETCEAVWSNVRGKRLLADFDGNRTLTVDFAQVHVSSDKLVAESKRIVRCSSLASSPAESIKSKLTRVDD